MATASMSVPAASRSRVRRKALRIGPRFLVALILAVLWATPVIWMIITSLKPENQIVTLPPRWLPDHLSDFTLDNYIKIFTVPRGVDLIRSFLNSLLVACTGTAV